MNLLLLSFNLPTSIYYFCLLFSLLDFLLLFYENWSVFELELHYLKGFSGGSDDKSDCNAGDLISVPGLRRFPGGGNGNPLQYSGLGSLMDKGI